MNNYELVSGVIDALFLLVVNGVVVLLVVVIVKAIRKLAKARKVQHSGSSLGESRTLEQRLAEAEPPTRRLGRTEIPSGWYDDPAEYGAKRFFDSVQGWTDRIKGHLSDAEYEEPRFPVEVDGVEVEFLDTLPEPEVLVKCTYFDWYPDPLNAFDFRYWDGTSWTQSVMRGGEVLNQAEDYAPQGGVSAAPSEIQQRESAGSGSGKHIRIIGEEVSDVSRFVSDLSALASMYERGLLDESEFARSKRRLLED